MPTELYLMRNVGNNCISALGTPEFTGTQIITALHAESLSGSVG